MFWRVEWDRFWGPVSGTCHVTRPSVPAALQLYQQRECFPAQHQRLSLGCPRLDRLLGGGLPLDGITELAGSSSAGKTQLALQLCLAVQFPRQHGGLEAGECRGGCAPTPCLGPFWLGPSPSF